MFIITLLHHLFFTIQLELKSDGYFCITLLPNLDFDVYLCPAWIQLLCANSL